MTYIVLACLGPCPSIGREGERWERKGQTSRIGLGLLRGGIERGEGEGIVNCVSVEVLRRGAMGT